MLAFIVKIIIVVVILILQTSYYTSDYKGHRDRTQPTKVCWLLSRPFSLLVGSWNMSFVQGFWSPSAVIPNVAKQSTVLFAKIMRSSYANLLISRGMAIKWVKKSPPKK